MKFITVCEYEDSEPVEIPLEEDDTVLFTTLSGQFPKVSGLKYRYSGVTNYRAVKLCDGKLYRPAEGWDDVVFLCVFPKEPADNKRKCREDGETVTPKTKRLEGGGTAGTGQGGTAAGGSAAAWRKCTDLIVLNLGWKVDEEMLRKYFCKFGDLVLVQVKKDRETSQSKGYAFVRFADYDSQVSCLAEKHLIDGRWCAVKVPFSKSEADKQEICKKIHVSYNSEDVTMEDLRKAFEEFGYVTDIFIPKPFRNFAFITFEQSDTAQQLIGRTITVKGYTITIGSAVPKITGNKKPIPAQFPIFPYNNDQTFTSRYGWPGYESNHQSLAYKTRQMRTAPYNHHYNNHHNHTNHHNNLSNNSSHSNSNGGYHSGGGMMPSSSNSSYMMGNSRTGIHSGPGLISVEYSHSHQHSHQASSDIGQNTAAMAALNILNNPDVVAAIVAAASKTGLSPVYHAHHSHQPHQQHQQGSM